MTNAAMQLAKEARKTAERKSSEIKILMRKNGRKLDRAIMISGSQYFDTLKELADK